MSSKRIFSPQTAWQFVRYAVVQVAAYALDYGVFYLLLVGVEIGPYVANILGKLVAASFAFFAHRELTFGRTRDQTVLRMMKYAVVVALNIPLSSLCLMLFLVWIPAELAKLLSDICCVPITFLLARSLVYKNTGA